MKLFRHNSITAAILLACFLLTGYLLTTTVLSQSTSHPCFYYLSMVMHYQSEVISAQDEISQLENQGYAGAMAEGGYDGMLYGAVGGATGGAIAGSAAGGMGAIPGAIAGGAGGAVTGGLTGMVRGLFEHKEKLEAARQRLSDAQSWLSMYSALLYSCEMTHGSP